MSVEYCKQLFMNQLTIFNHIQSIHFNIILFIKCCYFIEFAIYFRYSSSVDGHEIFVLLANMFLFHFWYVISIPKLRCIHPIQLTTIIPISYYQWFVIQVNIKLTFKYKYFILFLMMIFLKISSDLALYYMFLLRAALWW